MSEEPVLRLFAWGLLHKWGFSDGDLITDFLFEVIDAGLIEDHTGNDDFRNPYNVDHHQVLRTLVRKYLVPAISLPVEIYDIETNHNPIRASSVGGVEIDNLQVNLDDWPQLEDVFVEVSWKEVVRLCGFEIVSGEVIDEVGIGQSDNDLHLDSVRDTAAIFRRALPSADSS